MEMEAPECCEKPMELKSITESETINLNWFRLWFQCKKCGNVISVSENEDK